MSHAPAFTTADHLAIEELRRDLTRRIQRRVTLDFGTTDCGTFHDAAFCVDSLSDGSSAVHPLLTIIVSPSEAAGTFTALNADHRTLIERGSLADVLQAGRLAAVRAYRQITQ